MRSIALLAAASVLQFACADGPAPLPAAPSGNVEGTWAIAPTFPAFPMRSASRAIPAISGGTLIVLRDDRTAAISDPDHDVVWLADLTGASAPRRVSLRAGDEPGRLVEDDADGLHVVLRGGAVASIDPRRGAVTERRAVCAAPRGIAWNAALASLHVACADGELVTLPRTGAPTSTLHLARDLRDVAVHDGAVYVSRFREATVRRLTVVDGRLSDVGSEESGGTGDVVAWRMAAVPGGLVVLSQAVRSLTLGAAGGSFGGYYGTVTEGAVPMMPRVHFVASTRGPAADALLSDAGLTVDVAAFDDGTAWRVALASPGWAFRQGWG